MKESAFGKALSGMAYEAACKRAIRHLYDSGLDVGGISDALTYPVPDRVIEKEIELYESEKERERAGEELYDYIEESDRFGRISYRRVRREKKA